MNKESSSAIENSEVADLMKSKGWKDFIVEVARRGLYEYLGTCELPGLDYLLFLEQNIGPNIVQELCPLSVKLNDVFAQESLKIIRENGIDVDFSDEVLARLLGHYCIALIKRAELFWPLNIGSYLNKVIALIIRYNFSKALKVSGSVPIICLPKSFRQSTFYRDIDGENIFDDEGGISLSLKKELDLAFGKESRAKRALLGFVSSFSSGQEEKWEKIVAEAEEDFKPPELVEEKEKAKVQGFEAGKALNVDEVLELRFTEIKKYSDILGPGAAGNLHDEGIFTIRDLCLSKKEKLSRVPGIGDETIERLEAISKNFSLKFDMSEMAVERWKKRRRKRKFKI